MEDQLLNILTYIIPAVITGAIAYLFFKEFTDNENKRRDFLVKRDLRKETLPLRLQAYERMSLFLERIAPSKLLTRVNPTSSNKEDYENLLIATVEQEFEHNLTQQIYLSDQCWNIILTAKNSTIQLIRKANMNTKTDSADKLREVVLTDLIDKPSPSSAALSYIKEEVGELF